MFHRLWNPHQFQRTWSFLPRSSQRATPYAAPADPLSLVRERGQRKILLKMSLAAAHDTTKDERRTKWGKAIQVCRLSKIFKEELHHFYDFLDLNTSRELPMRQCKPHHFPIREFSHNRPCQEAQLHQVQIDASGRSPRPTEGIAKQNPSVEKIETWRLHPTFPTPNKKNDFVCPMRDSMIFSQDNANVNCRCPSLLNLMPLQRYEDFAHGSPNW